MRDDKLPLRVLVTDDDAELRGEIVEYLARKGLQVEEAVDGEEAVERLIAMRPDVLVMDLEMPALDGISAYRKISTLPDQDCEVILMSGSDGELERARELGCRPVMRKPFSLSNLHAYIRSLSGSHSS
jgi:CheY-like chemotaxis protein